MFTRVELKWMKRVLTIKKKSVDEVSASYIYRQTTVFERDKKRKIVRRELEDLRFKLEIYTPEEVLKLANEHERSSLGINNFSGVYIIHNYTRDFYYIGQSVKVFSRIHHHFKPKNGNPEIYRDYLAGHKIFISPLPLGETGYSSLNEFEDYAIRAYGCLDPYGYNRTSGNVMDHVTYSNEDYYKLTELLLSKLLESGELWDLTNDKKRINYIGNLFVEYNLPYNTEFQLGFRTAAKVFQKENKKETRKESIVE